MIKPSVNHILSKFAHRFVGNKIIRFTLKPIYDFYKKTYHKRLLNNFHKHGFEALCKFTECLSSNNHQYYLGFGTLLGAVRENNFIPHDDDIDLVMPISEYKPEIINQLAIAGFRLIRQFEINDGETGFEQTYIYKGITIDIFYSYPYKIGKIYCCDFIMPSDVANFIDASKRNIMLIGRKIILPSFKGVKYTYFSNDSKKEHPFSIPENYDEILKYRYGENYMIPNCKWNVKSHDENIIEVGKIGKVTCF